ncbi:substrate-binding domain-containing protein [Halocella sp. SP3-1]|uniref:substrate-binding domain-containing protein n=1 Tax=Halocella sp. SP3-1 TaxID=2382161 RepID=UPI000F75B8E3|nr:substrate-binding domain-containing protein [Halocella sp. SP3-1]AZO95302.1 hypothetical protein D7D81_12245 [Halocella sp. SP3-1]
MKRILCLLLVTMLVMSMSSISLAKSHEGIKVGLALMTTNNPFFVAMIDAVKEEAEGKYNGTVLVSDGQHDISKQLADVEDMIVQGIDLLLLNPVDADAAEPAVNMAKEAGIPVVCVDGDTGGDRDLFIASNNYEAGVIDARYIIERLEGEGKVVVLNGNPVSAVRQRYSGFMDTIKDFTAIEIVAEQNGDGDMTTSMQVMENVLQSAPVIDAVFAINDPSGLGALAAIQSAGRADEMFVVGVDGSPDAINSILGDSAFTATAAQEPAKIAKMGFNYGLKLIDGEELNIPNKTIRVPVKLITLFNADDFSW